MSMLPLHGLSVDNSRADSDCPSTWTPHTSTTCTARVYLTQVSPISLFMDFLACVSLRSSAKGAAPSVLRDEGHARLRMHLPQELEDKRLSKVETPRAAIYHIKHLRSLLDLNASGMEVSLGDTCHCTAAAQDRVQQ